MVAIVDLILAAIVLIFSIIGLARGFLKGVLSLVGTVVSLIAAFLLADAFIAFVNGSIWDVTGATTEMYMGWIGSIEGFDQPIVSNLADSLRSALENMNLPTVIVDPVVSAIVSATEGMDLQNQTIAGILSPVLADITVKVGAILLLFILIRLCVYIVEHVVDNTLLKIRALKALDRLLGLALGLVQAAIIIVLLFTGVSYFMSDPDSVVMQAIDDSTVGRYVYQNNPVPKWIAENLDIEQIIHDLFSQDESESSEENSDPTSEESSGSADSSEETSSGSDASQDPGPAVPGGAATLASLS